MGLRYGRSLWSRMLLVAALNLVLLCLLAAAATGVRSRQTLQQFLLGTAESRVIDVSQRLSVEMALTQRAELDALLEQYASRYGATFTVFRNNGTREAGPEVALPAELSMVFETSRRAALRLPPLPGQPLPPRTPSLVVDGEARGYWLGVRIPIRTGSSPETIPGTLVVFSPTFFGSALLFTPGPWLMWATVALVLTLLCWVPFLRGLTTRIGRMEQATARIADGRFATTLETGPRDELGRLATSIASMASRLGAQVTGQKRFLGDTAHELRSPLARMQVALAIVERDPQQGSGYVQGLQEDVVEMVRLTDDLLRLAREEQTAQTAPAAPVSVRDAVQRAVRLEGQNQHDVRVDVPSGLEVLMDPDALFRAVANVVRNAIRYAGDAGPITVTARTSGEFATISIKDSGAGVPADALPRLFEPFFRVDPARDRGTGGVGQGLAIVQSAVHAYGGTASCHNVAPHGLEVRLTLPVVRQLSHRAAGPLSTATTHSSPTAQPT